VRCRSAPAQGDSHPAAGDLQQNTPGPSSRPRDLRTAATAPGEHHHYRQCRAASSAALRAPPGRLEHDPGAVVDVLEGRVGDVRARHGRDRHQRILLERRVPGCVAGGPALRQSAGSKGDVGPEGHPALVLEACEEGAGAATGHRVTSSSASPCEGQGGRAACPSLLMTSHGQAAAAAHQGWRRPSPAVLRSPTR
jgi:hypothetical protein